MAKLFKQIPSKPNSTLISSIVKSNSVVLGLFLATVDNAFIFSFLFASKEGKFENCNLCYPCGCVTDNIGRLVLFDPPKP